MGLHVPVGREYKEYKSLKGVNRPSKIKLPVENYFEKFLLEFKK